jgi:hypothetical protein
VASYLNIYVQIVYMYRYTRLLNFVLCSWSSYPVLWLFSDKGLGLMSTDEEVCLYVLADVVSKIGFSSLLLYQLNIQAQELKTRNNKFSAAPAPAAAAAIAAGKGTFLHRKSLSLHSNEREHEVLPAETLDKDVDKAVAIPEASGGMSLKTLKGRRFHSRNSFDAGAAGGAGAGDGTGGGWRIGGGVPHIPLPPLAGARDSYLAQILKSTIFCEFYLDTC